MRKLPAIQHTEQLFYENLLRYNTCHLPRYAFATKFMNEKSVVMDFGGGAGYGSFILAGEAGEVFLVERNKMALDYAKKFYYRDNITYLNLDRPPRDWTFDVIVAFEVVEHVKDADSLMRRFYELMNPGGTLVVSVPNESIVPHAASNNHFHERHYEPEELDRLVTEAGFKEPVMYTQLAKGRPEIVPGSFGFTLLMTAKKL